MQGSGRGQRATSIAATWCRALRSTRTCRPCRTKSCTRASKSSAAEAKRTRPIAGQHSRGPDMDLQQGDAPGGRSSRKRARAGADRAGSSAAAAAPTAAAAPAPRKAKKQKQEKRVDAYGQTVRWSAKPSLAVQQRIQVGTLAGSRGSPASAPELPKFGAAIASADPLPAPSLRPRSARSPAPAGTASF